MLSLSQKDTALHLAHGVLHSLHFNVSGASINYAVKSFLFLHLAKKNLKSYLALNPFPGGSIIGARLPYGGCEMIKTVAVILCWIL